MKTMNLKPYSAYKDSGVSWLGKVPEHWKSFPGMALLKEKQIKNVGLKVNIVLSLSYGRIVIKSQDKLHGLVPESFETYQIVEPGDIIIRSTDLQNDKTSLRVGKVENNGIITSAYMCLKSKNGLSNNFAHLFLYALDVMKVFYGLGSGLRQNLSWADFKRLPFFLPSEIEQLCIVRFLDNMDHRIKKYICAKQKLIKLLEEQKQAIINDAVTGKIDVRTGKPYPKYKNSGVEWLGMVPEHWEVLKLKYIVHNINEQTDTQSTEEIYIALENVESWTGKMSLPKDNIVFESKVKKFRQTDILFGKLRPYLAKVTSPESKGVCVGEFLVLRPILLDAKKDFIELKLRSKVLIDTINASTFGAKMPRADWDFIGNLLFTYPPIIKEQNAILNYIKNNISVLELTISHNKHEITLIKEYRTRLIADVVTGKVDVREAAAKLLEEIVESDELRAIHESLKSIDEELEIDNGQAEREDGPEEE
jgi:type I restriction enzyme S subunit